jgi:ferric-dicitrate binding protein FerR (iron transport regulator)
LSDDDDKEIKELDAFRAPEPPPGFAGRLSAARPARRVRRKWPLRAAIVAVALSALFLVVVHPRKPAAGELAAVARTQRAIAGGRAIAVAEPGAHLSWRGDRVLQDAGDVFYRVAPGESFTVATPGGDVTVLGTCFRVEVSDMKSVTAAALGAAVSAAVLVTVYEGKVKLANAHGVQKVGPGEK